MKAMVLRRTALLSDEPSPLHLTDLPIPKPAADEVLLRVSVCGVCHTELDEIEGRLPPRLLPIVLGHEVVGRVEALGGDVTDLTIDERVGVGWIHRSSGESDENLSPDFVATGCDVNGGYAQFMTVPARYAVPIPESFSDEQAAPLMCAGAIGFRALRLTGIVDGDALGLMGFGGSAHLVLQTAKHLFPKSPVYVFAREPEVRQFAIELGADWAGAIDQVAPRPVRSVIDTTPAWRPVVASMQKLAPGGRLVINAIRKESADQQSLLELNYHEHLWMEREIKSVANLTLRDIAEFLPTAAEIPIRPEVTVYPLHEANEALCSLRRGSMRGSNVLRVGHD